MGLSDAMQRVPDVNANNNDSGDNDNGSASSDATRRDGEADATTRDAREGEAGSKP